MTDRQITASMPVWLDRQHGARALLVLAYGILFSPTYLRLSQTLWQGDEQGHGPFVLVVVAWLLYRRRQALAALPVPTLADTTLGWILIGLSLLCLTLGRVVSMTLLEMGAQPFFIAGLLLVFRGGAGLRLCAFPVFFLLFTVPLPGVLVAATTAPLKLAVSSVCTTLLHGLGYPIARQGVVLTIGPYQLLVADACAGLNSIFMLEALVLLYMNLMGYRTRLRNVFLVLAAVPISFAANVVRVIVLVLVTYYLGDAAGRGFVHDFAGILLLLVALFLTAAVDRLYGAIGGWGRTPSPASRA